ncbi:MAG TPA: SDR family oxidoreductase [Candidatus Cloacimonadota bacterium]|jgi:NAD(P)-dependent dehydrogenase (short-subunit alcohol dehydrogenase family)|nr:SDR family oxidoreductase [Candidatus Cloacimonadales bacterium]HPY97255.1 SDR family oxidoreductase [Candidatus Cloacimonadota bacterium]HQB40664.1 SDR family oxidoreductase [Candidatus Cloacimonadota bacterium]
MKKLMIIGANSNIGAYLANQYYGKYDLILHFHKDTKRITDLLKQDSVKSVQYDICNYKEISQSIERLFTDKSLYPDAVIFCATERSNDFKKLADTDVELIDRIIATNLTGLCYNLKILMPYLRQKDKASIVLFGSNVSRIGLMQGSVYAATKSAVSNLARSIAKEESSNNILINVISPGPVSIDASHFSEEYRAFREDYYKKQSGLIPLSRVANYTDIYNTIDFLLFNNSYITGEEIFITGGAL